MKWAKLTILFLLLLTLGNCKGQNLAQQSVPTDTIIMLERSICSGSCPDYKLTVTADGAVTFEGYKFVKVTGNATKTISQGQLLQLIAEFEKAKYFSLNDRYRDKEDGCPAVWTDYSTVITSIRINGKSKTISHYDGCQEGSGSAVFPKALTDLEKKIDEIVGTAEWIKP